MKTYDLSFMTIPATTHASPEQLLWLAVIDRALVDYVKWLPTLNAKQRGSLDWFLFEEQAVPNNLAYICEMLFDDHNLAAKVRKRARGLVNGDIKQEEVDRFKAKRYNLRVKSRFY
jgi:hypothetical protein